MFVPDPDRDIGLLEKLRYGGANYSRRGRKGGIVTWTMMLVRLIFIAVLREKDLGIYMKKLEVNE
jgi:hypothetical protein